MISEAHKQQLQLKYGLPESLVISLEAREEILSFSSQEVRDHLGRSDVDSTGFLLRYPGNGAATIRLDTPHQNGDGKPQKYIRRSGEPNHLYVPSGFDLSQAGELWIVEGELKSICGYAHGLPIVGLSGIWNWRTQTELNSCLAEGEKLSDEEALLREIAQASWEGKNVNLLYDSDIAPGHKAYSAFERLAEQLYRLGAEEVRVLTLPSLEKDQKTGLDEFILARGPEQAFQDLQTMKARKEPYLPTREGAVRYAERLIKSEDPEDRVNAVVAYLGARLDFLTELWLEENISPKKLIPPLLRTAKDRLKELQAKLKVTENNEKEEASTLGPEYDKAKELLKDYSDTYGVDNQGQLVKKGWAEIPDIHGNKHLQRTEDPLCNFVCWPEREVLKDNGSAQELYVEMRGLLQRGRPLKLLSVPMKDFEGLKWILSGWGVKASIVPYDKGFTPKELLRHAIQLMAKEIPVATIFTHLGWRKIGDTWVYLHAGGAVGLGSEAVEVEITDRLRKYVFSQETRDIKKALEASLSLLELGPKRIMYPLYSSVWLAPLCEPLRQAGIEPGHVTYLWGTTGSFKSTVIALLLSHFGNFDPKGLPASFRDTPKSIEEMAFLAKDTVLVVDDLYPAKDPRERAKLEGVLEYLTRNQGDRQGRGRLKATTELMTGHPPRGLAFCSGEVMPLSGSSLARNLVLHILREDINQDKLTQAQNQKALLPQAMRGYLGWLSSQIDSLSPELLKDFEHLRDRAKGESKTRTRHRRLDETVAFLYLGLHLFLNYAVSQGAISQDKAKKLLQDIWKTLNQVADELAQTAEREEPTKRFFEALLELQNTGRVYFATLENAIPEIADRTPGALKIGWGPDEKGVYYLLYGPAWEQVIKYLRTQEEGISLSKNSLLDSMEQQKLLDRSQGERRAIVKKIAGEQYRVLPILEKAFKVGEEEEGENEA